jgi:hypothetical protein
MNNLDTELALDFNNAFDAVHSCSWHCDVCIHSNGLVLKRVMDPYMISLFESI